MKGSVAIVTGASSGIGRCIALALAAEGATVGLIGRHSGRLQEVADLAGRGARIYPTDLASDDDLVNAANAIIRNFGQVHTLVHCAGIFTMGSIDATFVGELDRIYRVNVRAPYFLTQRLLPFMPRATGQIVFVNSLAGLTAKPGLSHYAASKHALKALADSLRAELSVSGIRVVSVYPARTATPMQAAIFQQENRVYQPELLLQPESVARTVVHTLTMSNEAEITDLTIRGVANMSVS